jgi:copper resistance protein C
VWAGLVATLCVLWGAPAQAHTDLVTASPGAGEQVSLASEQVLLEFASALLPGTEQVTVLDAQGRNAVAGDVYAADTQLVVPVDLRHRGRYTVAFQVMAEDGHPVTGSYSFVGTGSPRAAVASVPGGIPQDPAAVATGSSGGDIRLWALSGLGLAALLLVLHRAGRGAGTAATGRPATTGPAAEQLDEPADEAAQQRVPVQASAGKS